MNDETLHPDNNDASDLVNGLQDRVDELEADLAEALGRVAELQAELDSAPPVGDPAIRSLAVTYRTAVRNGHPDASKHLEALLRLLGA